MLIRKLFQDDIHVVFTLEPELENIELQHADHPADDLLHTCMEFSEDLDRTFLGDLLDPFDKLVSLHSIHLPYSREMFRCECGNSFVPEIRLGKAECVADRIQTRVENTDNITRIGLAEDLPVAGHQLLRLGQSLDPSALDMPDIHSDVVFSGADPDKCDPVSVGFVHIGLDLEDKSGKIVFYRIDLPLVRHAGRRRRRHLQEMLKEDLDAEVVER